MKSFLAIYGKPRYLGYVTADFPMARGMWIVASTPRGEELALIAGEISDEQRSRYGEKGNGGEGENATREASFEELSFLRLATDEDTRLREEIATEEDAALPRARELLYPHKLEMKLVDIEHLLDRKKMFFYFTSEQRVDFRAYVRDLAREFRTRIELRQLGIRDEAKVLGGIGPCGLHCCCNSWLNRFAPICIRMVKEQNIALNPTKISGICGRLMCCMGYEHLSYHELWEHLPNPGSKVRGPEMTYILVGVDLHSRSARLVGGGREILVPLADFGAFKVAVAEGRSWESAVTSPLAPVTPASAEERKTEVRSEEKPHRPRPKEGKRSEDVRRSEGERRTEEKPKRGEEPSRREQQPRPAPAVQEAVPQEVKPSRRRRGRRGEKSVERAEGSPPAKEIGKERQQKNGSPEERPQKPQKGETAQQQKREAKRAPEPPRRKEQERAEPSVPVPAPVSAAPPQQKRRRRRRGRGGTGESTAKTAQSSAAHEPEGE